MAASPPAVTGLIPLSNGKIGIAGSFNSLDGGKGDLARKYLAHLEEGQPLLSSGRDGLASVAAIWAAKQSAQRHGQQIDVPTLTIEAWEVVGQSP